MSSKTTPDELAGIAREKFELLAGLDGGPELLAEYEHTFQFVPTDVEAGGFYVDVREGQATVSVGTSDSPDVSTVKSDAETIRAILTGETAIVDEVWRQNAEAKIYGGKMEDTAWLSRMLKRIRNAEGKFIPRTSHTYHE